MKKWVYHSLAVSILWNMQQLLNNRDYCVSQEGLPTYLPKKDIHFHAC